MHELIAAVEKATCKEDLIKVLRYEFDRLEGDAKKQALIAVSCFRSRSLDWERAVDCFRAHNQSVQLSLECLEFIKAAKAEPYEDISELRADFAGHIKSLCGIWAAAWDDEFEAMVQVAADARQERLCGLDCSLETPTPPQMFVGVDYGYGTDEASFAVVEVQSDGTMKVADIERENKEFIAWRTRSVEEEDGTLKIGIDAVRRANVDKIKLSFDEPSAPGWVNEVTGKVGLLTRDEALVAMQKANPHLNIRRLESGRIKVSSKFGGVYGFTPTEVGEYLVKNGGDK